VLRIRIRIHMFWVSRIRILISSCQNSKKNLDSYYFVTLLTFLSLKSDVKIPSKSKKADKIVFKSEAWDPRIRINTKMLRIRNTDKKPVLRIRDFKPGSRIRLFSIPDPRSELFPSWIPAPHQRIIHPRIRIMTFYSSRIPSRSMRF